MTQIVYWDSETLNSLDSKNLRDQYTDTQRVYEAYYKLLIDNPDSPYHQNSSNSVSISYDEFLWAFTTVGARHLVFNN